MGLLLTEKKEWSYKFDKVRQELAEEQTIHLTALSEFERREENTRQALGVEKQFVADLEKAMQEMHAEIAEIKFTSGKKLADAQALDANIGGKHMDTEGKLHSTDAKLAEINCESADIDGILRDVGFHESKLQREILSLKIERKTHEKEIAEQREYLQEWEMDLQEGQKRLADRQRLLNDREERIHEAESALRKEEDLDEAWKKIESATNLLKDKENDIHARLIALDVKENDFHMKVEDIANKEKYLLAMEENIIARERGLKAEQDRLEREREQLSTYREKLDADQVEVQKDINASCVLTRNLKHQQNEFFKERKCFLALAEKCKICKSCGFTSELEHLGFQQLTSLEDAGNVVDAYLEENLENKNTTLPCYGSGSEPVNSGGRLSWLRKCSRLFSFSPGKRYDHRASAEAERSVLFCEQLDKSDLKGESNFEFPPLHGIYNDSFDARRATSGSGASDDLLLEIIHKVAAEPELFRVGTDDSTKIIKTQSSNVIRGRKYEPIVSLSNENDSQTELIKQRRSQSSGRGQSKAIKRTHSVEAVVADAKAFLGNNSELMDGMSNEDAIYSWNVHKENHGDYVNTSQIATNASRKRRVTHSAVAIGKLDAEDSEAYSDSVSMGGHHKRHQTSAPGIQASVEKRYNLRRSTIAGATQMMSDRNIGNKASNPQSHNENEMSKGEEGVFTIAASHENMETKIKLHKTDTDLEVQEISSQNLVKTETEVACVEFPDDIHSEFREPSCEDRGVIGEEAVTNTTTTSGEECGIEDDEDSSEDDGSGNASIGSKIWSFLTM